MSDLMHPNKINRDYVRLLQAMRRFIKEEFSVSIRMSQDDVVTQLLHYSGQSRNSVLQDMGKELRKFTGVPEENSQAVDADNAGEEVRYYRGVAVATESRSKPAASSETESEASSGEKKRPTRVYRGQVVNA